jgi:uncharacterized repeat protein (TIGR03806 family)
MKFKHIAFICLIITTIVVLACSEDDNTPYIPIEPELESPVVLDLTQVPYQNLSDYVFFEDELKEQKPVYGVIPFEPVSSLFTDYALKKRFVWMPKNSKATYTSDGEIFNFPAGAALIKTFYYDNVLPENTTKIIETRVMIKKEDGWIFANYIWNDEQTEAYLDLEGRYVDLSWNQNGETKATNYRIPSETECHTCHKKDEKAVPIGTKPQHLNSLYTYSDGSQNQLMKWVEFGYLEGSSLPQDIQTLADWKDTSKPLELRVRSYVDINCAHCHAEGSHCDYRPIRLAFNETESSTNLGVCVTPDEYINSTIRYIVAPRNHQRSAMYYRLTTNEESLRMPLLGRTLVHEEAVDMIEDWINSLENTCE